MAPDDSSYQTYEEICGRLDEIVGDVRKKDTSLERSLDLLDEAIELGSRAVEMVDKVGFSPEEQAELEAEASEDAEADAAAGEDAAYEDAAADAPSEA